ncbi:hypothetical protein G3U99_11005 [Vibrio coralliilyticus OCN008]|uniref:hypothetical protein n=1 Tax=Vibrio coralliilyticus TaxID=190893 RepID=UPI0003916C19|nr:hypothetical protein [Vibrio coralliilyticus]ERB62573.1 hypothetical protein N779_25490 [Vibrio coralliilyticus OCN008]QIJ84746.1 hypothetical protein G3U99_11005 [Vibrio coralliilyticus OCN008]
MHGNLFKGVKDFVCVYFWCQHVHNYNYGLNKKGGVIWPFVLTSSLIGIFTHGFYMMIEDMMGFLGTYVSFIPYIACWMFSAYLTYLICMKDRGFERGERYFDAIEEPNRKREALYVSVVFTLVCFSSRIFYFVIATIMSVLR